MTTSAADSIEVMFHDVDTAVHDLRAKVAAPPRKSTSRWPLVVCALVAMVAGGEAVLESPVADRPEVRPYAAAVRGATHAAATEAWREVQALRVRVR